MIRQCTIQDVAQIHALEQQCFGMHGWTIDMIQSEINNTYCTVLAYTSTEGDIVGYLSARTVADVVEIGNVAVAQQCRRQGIARAMLSCLADKCHKPCTIMLEVCTDNSSAVALYNSCGYSIVNTRHNFYAEGRYTSRHAYTMINTLQ